MKPECGCGKSEVIENTAMGKAFFYCRGCKSEVTAQLSEMQNQIDKLQQEIVQAQQTMAVPRLWVNPGVHGNGQPMAHGVQATPPRAHAWLRGGANLAGGLCLDCGVPYGTLSASSPCPGLHASLSSAQRCYHYNTKTKPNPVGGTDVECASCTLAWWIP